MSDPTRERIIDAAEGLFAENGFARTSLRAITARAGVNLAAVNYHFGSKQALIQAIFIRRLVPINEARLEHLSRLLGTGNPSLEELLHAFIRPSLASNRHSHPGEVRFIRLLGRTHTGASAPLREFVHSLYADVFKAYGQALAGVLPALAPEELAWRLHFMMGALSYAMAGGDAMRVLADTGLPDDGDDDRLLGRLTTFLAAGLRAPASAEGTGTDPAAA